MSDTLSISDVMAKVSGAFEQATKEIGKVNILIVGRTGVGKSTIINEVFAERLTETGSGKPVTQGGLTEWTKKGVPLAIFDTKGIETADYESIFSKLINEISMLAKSENAERHIHVAWFCIAEDGRRIEDSDTKICESLLEYVPLVAIITKARNDQGFRQQVQDILPNKVSNVVRVRALGEKFDDGHVMEPFGINDLIEVTSEILPEATQMAYATALSNANKYESARKLKRNQCDKAISIASAAAATAGATPIPFADAAIIIPIQITMMAKMSTIHGLDMDPQTLKSLVVAAGGILGATMGGRALVSGLLKLIPGIGTISGGVISATTAAALTTLIGKAYLATLEQASGQNLSPSAFGVSFKDQLRTVKK